MRMAPLSERSQMLLLSPIIVPVCVAGFVAFVVIGPLAWALSKVSEVINEKRRMRGRHLWFAWRPVWLNGFYYDRGDKLVWLETIERRFSGAWFYNFPGELDKWERQEVAPQKGTANDRGY